MSSRPRPGRAGASFDRMTAQHAVSPVVGETETVTADATVPRHHGITVPNAKQTEARHFSVRFYDATEADRVDDFLRDARRIVGHRPSAARLVREALREVFANPETAARIHDRMRPKEEIHGGGTTAS